jgi:hypothetical protein
MTIQELWVPEGFKRSRRTKAEIEAANAEIDAAVIEFAEQERPVSVRQCFYHLVSKGLVEKTDNAYRGVVCKRLGILRDDGLLPWEYVADNTRWVRQPLTFSGAPEALRLTADTYRQALWEDQPEYVQVWVEKDGLTGVLGAVTDPYDVPLLATRGYPSKTYLHKAANLILEKGKPTHIYYFGDLDPSGECIPAKVEEVLRYEKGCEFSFTRAAVTVEQVIELGLQTRPTKETDTRSRNWSGGVNGESVEVDAIPPSTLREMVDECIWRHIDGELFKASLARQKEVQAKLTALADEFEVGPKPKARRRKS